MKFLAKSLLALMLLYGMVFAIGDAYLLHNHASLWWGLAFPVVLIGAQFLIAPKLIEWMLSIDWDENELPAVHRAFIEKLCAEKGLPMPRVGVIHSSTPNAFCFGRVRSDARLVVTDGLLEILTPEEIDAVLAHEVGHIAHYDFAVMAVAALAPMILYQIYAFGRHNNHTRPVAYGAYAAYWVGRFVVLSLNRVREASADHFSAHATHEPNELSSALVKIAYGMVQYDAEARKAARSKNKEKKAGYAKERRYGSAISLLGIASFNAERALALTVSDPVKAAAVMRWDLMNPWASIYQLSSTHPLTALRVRAMNQESETLHQGVRYPLPDTRDAEWPWMFPVEVALWAAPWICAFLLLADKPLAMYAHTHHYNFTAAMLHPAWLFLALGVTWMLRIAYRYHGDFKPESVGTLLEDVEVSEMRPRGVELRGEIVGNGLPGAFWSADLVMRDETGMMFLLYRSSIPFGRLLFALTHADQFVGEQVVVKGWFRRGLRPYVEMSELTGTVTKVGGLTGSVSIFSEETRNATVTRETLTQRSYSRWIQFGLSAAATAVGLVMLPV